MGGVLGFPPSVAAIMPGMEQWISARYLLEALIFYSSLPLLIRHGSGAGPEGAAWTIPAWGLFLLGFALFFFEARSLALFTFDSALMEGYPSAVSGAALGLALGFSPLLLSARRLRAFGVERFFSPAALVVTIGAAKFLLGGVAEAQEGSILVAFQRGMQYLVEHAVDHLQRLLLIREHAFIRAPFQGLAEYLRQDRLSTAIAVAFVMIPPLLVLVRVFSRPDPEVVGIRVAAERRLKVAFFRREMISLSAPLLVCLFMLMVSFHAVSAGVNPLSEPKPMAVSESEESPGSIVIPLEDMLGDFSNGKLRKYVFFHGNDRIIFLAIMKPDGTLGVALDECEICRPADWNTAAQGYAQRGDHLICKYCMSPIAIPTVNKPGGCNPIPVPFEVQEGNIEITVADIVRVHKAARALVKKGTHL